MPPPDDTFSAFAAEVAPSLQASALLVTGDRRHAAAVVTTALAATRRRWRRLDPDDAGPAARSALVRVVLGGDVPETVRRLGDDLADDDLASAVLTPPDLADSELTAEDLTWLAALAGLPVRARLALVLRLHDGLPDDETARLLDTDPATVAGLVQAALRDVGPLLDDARPAAVPVPAAAPGHAAAGAAHDPVDPDDDPYAIYRRPR